MLFGIKTDQPEVIFYLYDDVGRKVDQYVWAADRTLASQLLQQLDGYLSRHGLVWRDVRGMFIYAGPGSFTGLRIGHTVVNAIAYAEHIPLVSTQGDKWCNKALSRLLAGDNDGYALPSYGEAARIIPPNLKHPPNLAGV